MTAVKFCPSCGQGTAFGEQFCTQCGRGLSPTSPTRGGKVAAIAKFLGIMAGFWVLEAAVAIGMFQASKPNPLNYTSQIDYDAAVASAQSTAQGAAVIAALIVLAVIASRVGYRKRDAFMALIPFYGIVFLFRTLWRCANLSAPYWTPRAPAGTPPRSSEHLAGTPT